jgi:hypothetical protein
MTPTHPGSTVTLAACAACLAALIGGGCAASSSSTKRPATTRPLVSPAELAAARRVRENYARASVESRVGVIVATRPRDRLVAVYDVDPADFRTYQTVAFLDPNQRLLSTGTIVRLLPDSIHVRYDDSPAGGRAPRKGDLLVRLPAGGTPL